MAICWSVPPRALTWHVSVPLLTGAKKYAVILAFDVPVAKEARELAEEYGVKVFTADIIYHLFDQFTVSVSGHLGGCSDAGFDFMTVC